MDTLVFETYVNEKPESTIKIPLAVFKIVAKCLPRKITQAMETKGFNVQELVHAAQASSVSGKLLEVDDHQDNERVIISVR